MSITFTPVPVRARRDGWTPERQHAFIAALAATRCIAAAARRVGLSFQTAYRLRARAGAESFAAAWDAALAGPDLTRPISGRALGGTTTPITYRGRKVGERRRYDTRLGRYLLAIRQPERFGHGSDRMTWDEDEDAEPHTGSDFPADVARMSSPSASARPQPGGPIDRPAHPASLRAPLSLRSPHAHRRHPALRRPEHLRPHPA